MRADILATGSELVSPDRLDTNSLWITSQLNMWGVEVRRKLCIGDDLDLMTQELITSLQRADLVFVTGGLGPTEDDVTRAAVSKATERPLEFSSEQEAWLRDRFAQMGRSMTDNNLRQCYLPSGSHKLDNPNGTAPGFWLTYRERSHLFSLPGPPNEMKPMFTGQILPLLEQWCGKRQLARRTLRVIGLGESALDEKIAPIYTPISNPTVGLLFSPLDVEIRLSAVGESEEEAQAVNDLLAGQFYEVLGSSIYAEGEQTLAEVVGELLHRSGRQLGILDNVTGGLVSHRLVCHGTNPIFSLSDPQQLANSWVQDWVAAGPDRCLLELQPGQAADGSTDENAIVVRLRGRQERELRTRIPGKGEIRHSRMAQLGLDCLRRLLLDQGTGSNPLAEKG